MKRWVLITGNKATLLVEQEEQPTTFQDEGVWIDVTGTRYGMNWRYNDGVFSPPYAKYSKSVFLDLLGNTYVTILTASKTDVELEVWVDKLRSREEIDMSEFNIDILVSKNLIEQKIANNIIYSG